MVTSPLYEIAGPNLGDLLRFLGPFANTVYLLRGKLETPLSSIPDDTKQLILNTDLIRVIKKNLNIMSRLVSYGLSQLIVTRFLLGLGRKVEVVLFYQSGLGVPALAARTMQKKVLVYFGGSGYRSLQAGNLQDKLLSLLIFAEEAIMAALANKVIVVTRQVAIPISKSRVFEAPTRLLDQKFFQRYRGRRGRSDNKVVVGYVGRLSPEKGVEELVDAFPLIVAKIPSAELLLVGDGPLKHKIEAKITEYSLQSRVSLTGWVSNVEAYLNKMSLIVLPSKTEGLPTILLEAIACKTPVLASMVGATPSIIKEDKTGFLLKSLELEYIAEKIIDLSGKPEVLRNVSSKAYVWLKENYSAKTASDSWSKVFESITRT